MLLSVLISAFLLYENSKTFSTALNHDSRNFDELGRFIMYDFDHAKPMSNFLNGLGGLWGIPLWCFFVNRGQAIASFGLQNKDGAMFKFTTANVAYQEVPFTGFRTFIKAARGANSWKTMPFFPNEAEKETVSRKMYIGNSDLEIEETNTEIGLQTNIVYFSAPDSTFPCLIRSVTFTNLNSDSELKLEVLDGLGRIVPSGLSNGNLDSMGRTMEAWMNVYNVGNAGSQGNKITKPFFHISQDTADSAEVRLINDGHFAISFNDGDPDDASTGSSNEPLPFVVDPSVVYGFDTTLTHPSGFYDSDRLDELLQSPQGTSSRTPCAFAGTTLNLPPGGRRVLSSVYGHASSLEDLLDRISPEVLTSGFVKSKRQASRNLVEQITNKVSTSSGSILFDSYVKQVGLRD